MLVSKVSNISKSLDFKLFIGIITDTYKPNL